MKHSIIVCLYFGLIQTACSDSALVMTLRSVAPDELELALDNTPEELSNLSSLDIALSGVGIKKYRYKLGRAEDIDCASAANYSTPVNINTKITDSLTTLPDAELRLCVIASNIYDNWQKLTQATQVLWTKDTTAPVVAMSFPNRDGLSVGYKAKVEGTCTTDDGRAEIKFTSGATKVTQNFDCSTGSFTRYVDLSSLAVGTVSFELSQTDAAGNTHFLTRSLRKHTSRCDSLNSRQNMNAAGFAGGSGVLGDPYILCTIDQLNDIRNTTNKFFRLGNDLYFEAGDSNGDFLYDGSDTDYTSGEGWLPLPSDFEYLEGEFHSLSGLRINRPTTDEVGLFGRVSRMTIQDLQVIDAQVIGRDKVGTLLGINYATPFNFFRIRLIDSSVTGANEVGGIVGHSGGGFIHSTELLSLTVSGQNQVGGLVGYGPGTSIQSSKVQGAISGVEEVGGLSGSRGYIYNSSAKVTITGTGNQVGGLAGRFAEIYSSYAEGQVSSTGTHVGCLSGGYVMPVPRDSFAACDLVSGSSNVGFVSGQNQDLVNSYYSSSMSCTQSAGGSCTTNGSTSSSNESFYGDTHPLYDSWDFRSNPNDGRSELWVANPNSFPSHFFEVPYDFSSSLSGEGNKGSPYLISSTSDLLEVASNPFYQRAHFKMTQDIDLSLAPSFEGLFRDLTFEGSFDGGGFRVLNLSISDAPTSINTGFFGSVTGQAKLSRLHVQVDTLSGGRNVGALVGHAHSKNIFEKLGSSGSVIQAESYAGGLIGSCNTTLQFTESHIDIQCTGARCGGLTGMALEGQITDSYATGNVTGASDIGGLIGSRGNGISIERTYATGHVTGTNHLVGGLIGANYESTTYSFALGNVTGNDASSRVGYVFGFGSATPNYYLSTASCTNLGGSCNLTGTAVGPLSYFYNKANPPLNSWDFGAVWQENPGALPSLRDMP